MISKLFSGIIIMLVALSELNAFAGVPPALSEAATAGIRLFTGQKPFENGGAACISCHSVNSIKAVGGSLGPNLTAVYKQLGKNGLNIVLKSIPFPTMKPIYQNRPITEKEKTGLISFLRYSSKPEINRNKGQDLFMYAAAVFAILIIFMSIIWRNRLSGVRRTLIKKA
ncbi:MAG: hypothetical protein GXP60_06540 [Epsilonproteobacteria bacterium]|nr:hypothetical protein [Campylobacterota bacterium]